MSLFDRVRRRVLVAKSAGVGMVVTWPIVARAIADERSPGEIAMAVGLGWVSGTLLAALAVWIGVWRGWLAPSSYRYAIDRVIERENNGDSSEAVYLAQNQAWAAIRDGAFWDPWPTRVAPPKWLLVASTASWFIVALLL